MQGVSRVIHFYAEDSLFHVLPVVCIIRVLKSFIFMWDHASLLSPGRSLFCLQGEFEYGILFSLVFS